MSELRKENIILSHYYDWYFKANKERFEKQRRTEEYKDRMIDELSTNTMVRIMFRDFLDKKSDYDVIDLAEKHLR